MMASDHLESLLTQCKLNPRDDIPRLELARWLDENGEPQRAEFIRRQLRTDADDSIEWYPGRPEDEAVECRLLKKNVRTWTNGLIRNRFWLQFDDVSEDEAVKRPAAKFERGTLSIHLASLSEMPYLLARLSEDALPWLERLETGALESDLPRTSAAMKALTRFTSFSFSCPEDGAVPDLDWLNNSNVRHVRVAKEGSARTLKRMASFSNLRPHSLSIGPDDGDLSGFQAIVNSEVGSQARSVEMSINDDDAALQIIADTKHLTELDHLFVGGDNFSARALNSFFDSPNSAKLTSLTVSGYSGQLLGVAGALARSRKIRGLRELDLGFNAIESEELIALAKSPIVENLRSLSFSSGQVTDNGVRALTESAGLSQLESLDLACAGQGDSGAMSVVKSPHMANLRFLSLCRCEITDRTVRALAASPFMARLEEIDLSLNPMSPTAIGALAASEHLGNLRYLRFEQPMDIAAFRRLMASPVVQNLEGLAIGGPDFGSEHVKALAESANLGKLRKLTLSAPSLRPGDVNVLFEAAWLPGIVDLWLSSCGLNDQSVRKLTELPKTNLAMLQIGESAISREGATAFLEWPGINDLVDLGLYGNPIPANLREKIDRAVTGKPPLKDSLVSRVSSWVRSKFSG
jgi:uncharacterized protein (TIGR02996 family)